ncbi:MAG: hypothetical protein EZS28_012880 [Streblomastix strix]|uniref:Tyr recombinase domain-containing protein n=1 Tax=Streblomastix strix TaxID=222440 RepID=A0A5J4WAC2_9EUKA|nr:MAG: hypothetical protein EZS28_012880 [Streblomastix strix]
MMKTGIARRFIVASVRSATITKLTNKGANATAVDRFTHHSNIVKTMRLFYYKNNNDKVRALIAEIKEKSADNSEYEIEAEAELGLTIHTRHGDSFSTSGVFAIATLLRDNNSLYNFNKTNSCAKTITFNALSTINKG